jgi:hypothetical protein
MPAAQGEVTNREVRFTLRFRRTITIAAASVSSSFVIGPAQHAAQCRVPADDRASCGFCDPFGNITARRNPNSRAMTRRRQQAEAKPPKPANDRWIGGDFSAGRLRRRLSERSGESGHSGRRSVPGTRAFRGRVRPRERGRRRTRQDQISCRALGPVKLRIVKDTRTERRKTCFFCRTGFERAGFF